VERFVGRQNIEHFREMLKITTDPDQRQVLEKLLLEAQAKLKKDEEDHRKNLSIIQTEPDPLEDRGVARRPNGRA